MAADWRRGFDIAALQAALAADTGHDIKAVGVVHNETSTGMMIHPIPEAARRSMPRASGAAAGRYHLLARLSTSGWTNGASMPRWAAARRG